MIIDTHWRDCDGPVGPILKDVILTAHSSCVHENDHFPLLILGATNSGKSNFGLWTYEIIHPQPEIWRVTWTRDEFAKVQARVARERMPRFVQYDELDAESKEAMSSWNRQFKRLFDKVRYSNIFWVLINPSANYIDKSLIEDEVIKGLVVIRDKSKSRPREVLYYTQDSLLQLLDDGHRLSLRALRSLKVAKKYAFLRSWFREYDGVLKESYDAKKASRTIDIHDAFAQEYGVGETFSLAKAAKILGVDRKTLRPYVKKAIESGVISGPGLSGQHNLSQPDIEELRFMMLGGTQ